MRLDPFSALYGRTPMDAWHRQLAGGERAGFDEQLGIWLIVGHDFHLIARLLRYRAGDDARPTETEVAAIVLNVRVAGSETTAGLIGQALEHALLGPARWAQLASAAHYASIHVEETLRYSHVIGAALARIETTTAITALARRLPGLSLTGDYQRRYRPSAAVRSHLALPADISGSRCPVAHAASVMSPL